MRMKRSCYHEGLRVVDEQPLGCHGGNQEWHEELWGGGWHRAPPGLVA